jgi:poly(3-hydroxybutyrate) depolymerase
VLSILAAVAVLVAAGVGVFLYTRVAANRTGQAQGVAPATPGGALSLLATQAAETSAVLWNVLYVNTKSQQPSTRSCWVTVPAGFSSASAADKFPVYFFFHGTSVLSSAAENACRQLVGSGCVCFVLQGSELANDGGTVYSWDVNDSTGADDLSLVRALYENVATDARLDLARCFACGHSVGSLFVGNVLAAQTSFFTGGHLCLSSQLLVGTDLSGAQAGVKIAFVNGDEDPLIPFGGGAASFDASLTFHSVADAVGLWAAQNACAAPATATRDTFAYFPVPGQPSLSVAAAFTRYAAPCARGLVAGYILSGAGNYQIKHDTIAPALNLFGAANTAAMTLAAFGDAA